jgi:hypothetical protein
VILEKSVSNKYLYYKPLCYQLFTETENKKSWGEKDGTFLMGWIKNATIQVLGLDKRAEFGFFVLYCIAKFLLFLFLFSFIVMFSVMFITIKQLSPTKIRRKKYM